MMELGELRESEGLGVSGFQVTSGMIAETGDVVTGLELWVPALWGRESKVLALTPEMTFAMAFQLAALAIRQMGIGIDEEEED